MKTARRLDSLAGYAFAELDRLRDARAAAGADVIDFGVGDPREPVPEVVAQAAVDGVWSSREAGYPAYVGGAAYRAAAAAWCGRRFGVALDADTEVSATVGSKEAVFHLPLAFADPGDVVLCPSPGYPPYGRGALCAGARASYYAVGPAGEPLPDLDDLPAEVAERLAVVWITQPHVPTGRAASLAALERLAAQARERGVLLCSDEAYSELGFRSPPHGALETGTENVLAFHSLSKRSAMTGYRVGFVAGDRRAVAAFRSVKTNVDSGVPHFIEDAACAALADEDAPRSARAAYEERARILAPALRDLGCDLTWPDAGLYLWVRAPEGLSGVEFARRLLAGPAALAVMPGEWLADPVEHAAAQPGDGYVRFALVPAAARCREAAARLAASSPSEMTA